MTKQIDRKLVESGCSVALASLGFTMRRGIGTIHINDEFSAWIGLNVGKHEGFIRINPFVGVHCQNIMKMTSEAKGEKYKPFEIASFAVFLGTLKPDIPQFIFSDENDVPVEARRLAEAVAEFGLPFVQTISSYERLLPHLKERVPMLGGYPQRYAAALYLSGDRLGAIEFLDSCLAEHANREADLIDVFERLKAMFIAGWEARVTGGRSQTPS